MNDSIRVFQTGIEDAVQAAQAFHAELVQPDLELVIFFCSTRYDLDSLAGELRRLFGTVQVVGCTAAGEFGPEGYLSSTLVGVSFAAGSLVAVSDIVPELQRFTLAEGSASARALLRRLQSRAPQAGAANSFGMMLIDGLSMKEEQVAFALQQGVGDVPLIGGSAADDAKLSRTLVYYDGAFHTDCAVLLLVTTTLPFLLFRVQHFVAGDERMVVTDADVDQRIVKEINGRPAAEEYARLVGVPVSALDANLFARSPLVVRIGGGDYVRSIQKIGADGSLVFYCAIDLGLVMRLARPVDIEQNLQQTLASLQAKLGEPQLVIGFDCVLRGLEMEQLGNKGQMGEILRRYHALGFGSYGEQYCGIHMNQTLTGVALGRKEHDERS